jgi:methionyl-tRNA synthetase
MNKRFFITTAIDYVNGQPHLGHAYEKRGAALDRKSSS